MSDSVQNLIAEPEDKGTRIDKYLSQELEDVSRSRIQKLLDDGDITVDDKCVKSNYKLNGTEHITITIPELIVPQDRKSTRLNSSHRSQSRMPSSA